MSVNSLNRRLKCWFLLKAATNEANQVVVLVDIEVRTNGILAKLQLFYKSMPVRERI